MQNKYNTEENSGYMQRPECNETDLGLCLHNIGAAFILWVTTCTTPPSIPLLIQDT